MEATEELVESATEGLAETVTAPAAAVSAQVAESPEIEVAEPAEGRPQSRDDGTERVDARRDDGTERRNSRAGETFPNLVIGTVEQSEPGQLAELLGAEEGELEGSKYVLISDVSDRENYFMPGLRLEEPALVEDLGNGDYAVYELDKEQLKALANSDLLDSRVELKNQFLSGDVVLDAFNGNGPLRDYTPDEAQIAEALFPGSSGAPRPLIAEPETSRAQLEAEPANGNIGSRYSGPIVDVDETSVVQQVDINEFVRHDIKGFPDDIQPDPEKRVEVAYNFDGPEVRDLTAMREAGLER